MFTTENLLNVGKVFLSLFGQLFFLFIGISFLVALIQVYVSKERIQGILTTPRKSLNSIFGALLGAITPFCSCSSVPILVGLIRSGAPFSGTMSFLLISPVLNPAIITLFLTFFGVKAMLIYAGSTLTFSVAMGLAMDKLGFAKEIKQVSLKGCAAEEVVFEKLPGTFWHKNLVAWKHSIKEAVMLFRSVVLYLLLGAGIGAIIYGFVPAEFFSRFAGASNLWAVPAASIIGIPMYIRAETMIPIASVLISKGVGYGVVIALIIGGAGASIPEVSLLASIFKKKMIIAFLSCVIFVATATGFLFNIVM